jgi:DNA-binding MarR family transcriptional regulator
MGMEQIKAEPKFCDLCVRSCPLNAIECSLGEHFLENQGNIDQHLLRLMRSCGHVLYKLGDGKGGQQRILFALLNRDKITQRDLLDIIDIKSASLSEVLGKIEEKGNIKRVRNEVDKRNVDIMLTEQGKMIALQKKERYDESIRQMFSCLTDEEKDQLLPILEKLRGHWHQIRDEIGVKH